MEKQELHYTLRKTVNDKVPNVTNEEMNRKPLSGFLHAEKWCALKPDVSPKIEPDNDFKFRALVVPDNAQTQIPIKHNFSQTFERDEFDGRVMNKSEIFCVFWLVVYFTSFFFWVSFFCLFYLCLLLI